MPACRWAVPGLDKYLKMKKKHRGENWSAAEKEIFINIMKHSVRIIECKNTDSNSNKRKQAEWCKVQKKFEELTGKLRDVAQLKGFWKRKRMVAKKNVFQHRRALKAIGGVERKLYPSQEDQKIMEMCSTELVTEENEQDSDGIFYKNKIIHKNNIVDSDCSLGLSKPTQIDDQSQQEDRTHILDIKDKAQEGENNNSFSEEIVGENVHNSEVAIKRASSTSNLDRELKNEKFKMKIGDQVTMSTPHKPNKTIIEKTRNCSKIENSHKPTLLESNVEIKDKTFKLLEEEYALKLQYQRQELRHQELRHKLELEILLLEKEKKECELKLIKK